MQQYYDTSFGIGTHYTNYSPSDGLLWHKSRAVEESRSFSALLQYMIAPSSNLSAEDCNAGDGNKDLLIPLQTELKEEHGVPLVDPSLHALLRRAKDLFSEMGSRFTSIRGKINPYECLGKGPKNLFINRSATKLANLDSVFSLIDTNLESPVTFLDLCGGPGGFTEYITMRCAYIGRGAIGFGMSLLHPDKEHSCNWSLEHLHCPPYSALLDIGDSGNTDISLYLEAGGKDGDILERSNIEELRRNIYAEMKRHNEKLQSQQPPYVELVLADGGIDFDKSCTETLAASLLLSQVAAMLQNICAGGTFVMKFFSNHETCSFDIFLLVSCLFRKVVFIKPVTSRPATGEIYLVAKHFSSSISVEDRELLSNAILSRVDALKRKKYVLSNNGVLLSSGYSAALDVLGAYSYCRKFNDRFIRHQLYSSSKILAAYVDEGGDPANLCSHKSAVLLSMTRLCQEIDSALCLSESPSSQIAYCSTTKKRKYSPIDSGCEVIGQIGLTERDIKARDYFLHWELYQLQDIY